MVSSSVIQSFHTPTEMAERTGENVAFCFPRRSSGQNPMEPVLVHTTIPTNIPLHHVLIKVDRFGFSANNITYQALGEAPHFRFVFLYYTRLRSSKPPFSFSDIMTITPLRRQGQYLTKHTDSSQCGDLELLSNPPTLASPKESAYMVTSRPFATCFFPYHPRT
jgi:hypothetical protein